MTLGSVCGEVDSGRGVARSRSVQGAVAKLRCLRGMRVITVFLVYTGAYESAGPVVGFTTRELADGHVERLKAEGTDAWVEPIQLMDRRRGPGPVPVAEGVTAGMPAVRGRGGDLLGDP